MPYSVRKKGSKWQIVKLDTGKVVGESDTEEKARASIRARESGIHDQFEQLRKFLKH